MERARNRLFLGLAVTLFGACGARPPLPENEELSQPCVDGVGSCLGRQTLDRANFRRHVALTFDDGPVLATTGAIVAELRARRLPATFFVLGARMRSEEERALVAEIAADPLFLLGNHTFAHHDMAAMTTEAAEADVARMDTLLGELGVATPYFRFPYGSATYDILHRVEEAGRVSVGWDVDTFDWCFSEGRGVCTRVRGRSIADEHRDDYLAHVMESLERTNGGVVLLHDVHAFTAEHLPALLDAMGSAGYVFTRLDDAEIFPRRAAQIARIRARAVSPQP